MKHKWISGDIRLYFNSVLVNLNSAFPQTSMLHQLVVRVVNLREKKSCDKKLYAGKTTINEKVQLHDL